MNERGQWTSRHLPRLLDAALLLTFFILLVLVLGRFTPSIVRNARAEWAQHGIRKAVEENWPQLTDGAPREARVLVEFLDYQCPGCRVAHDSVLALSNDEDVSAVVYRHLPLNRAHPRAEEAARVAICAEARGAFGAIHDYLLVEEWWTDSRPLSEVVVEAGLMEGDHLGECVDDSWVDDRLAEDRRLADLLGVSGTPAFVGAGGMRFGFRSRQDLLSVLD